MTLSRHFQLSYILRSEQSVFRPICTESIFHIGPMHTFIYLQNWKIWHKLRNYEIWTFHKVSNSKTSNCVIRKQQRTAKTRLFTNGYILFYSLTGDLHSNHLSSDFLSNFFFVPNFPQPTKFPDFSRFPYISGLYEILCSTCTCQIVNQRVRAVSQLCLTTLCHMSLECKRNRQCKLQRTIIVFGKSHVLHETKYNSYGNSKKK